MTHRLSLANFRNPILKTLYSNIANFKAITMLLIFKLKFLNFKIVIKTARFAYQLHVRASTCFKYSLTLVEFTLSTLSGTSGGAQNCLSGRAKLKPPIYRENQRRNEKRLTSDGYDFRVDKNILTISEIIKI